MTGCQACVRRTPQSPHYTGTSLGEALALDLRPCTPEKETRLSRMQFGIKVKRVGSGFTDLGSHLPGHILALSWGPLGLSFLWASVSLAIKWGCNRTF